MVPILTQREWLNFPAERIVPKKWGEERWLANLNGYCAKLLIIVPGWRCSTHFHKRKNESFIILAGSCVAEVNGKQQLYVRGQRVDVPSNTPHWFGVEGHSGVTAIGAVSGTLHPPMPDEHELCVLLEVSTLHDDADVVRIDESQPFKYSSTNLIKRMENVK